MGSRRRGSRHTKARTMVRSRANLPGSRRSANARSAFCPSWPSVRRKVAIRWSMISTGTRMRAWRRGARPSETTENMPSLLAAAIALLAWEEIDPLQHKAWLGRLLVGAILRGRSRTLSHLLCVNTGLREIARDRRRARDSTTKLVALLDGFAEAARWGMKEHDRWLLARRQLDRRLVGRRSNSSLPALADLVVARPILSAGLIARELKVTPRAAQDLVAELDLREMTGRGRYRAWGIL